MAIYYTKTKIERIEESIKIEKRTTTIISSFEEELDVYYKVKNKKEEDKQLLLKNPEGD